jgi:hypothetical protein
VPKLYPESGANQTSEVILLIKIYELVNEYWYKS